MKKLLTILFLLFAITVNAQTYISPAGNDATGNGSQATPYKTLYKATSVATSGIIKVLAGTYTETQVSNLRAGVSIEGDGAATTIIKGAMTNNYTALMELQSPDRTNGNQSISKITFDGQYVSATNNKTWLAIWVTGRSNVSIHDCVIKNFLWRGVIFNGINADNPGTDAGYFHATGNKFYNNTMTNCADYGISGGGSGALNLGFQDGMLVYNNLIQQNERPEGKNGWPIKYWNQGWLKGCKFYDNTLIKKPYGGTYPGESGWDFAIEFFNVQGLEFYNNNIQNGAIDMSYIYKGSYPYSAWIHDNVIHNPVQNTKVEGAIILEFRAESVLIENNIIKNKTYGVTFNTRTVNQRGDDRNNFVGGNVPGGYSYLVNNVIRNNLFVNMYNGSGIGNRFAVGVISEGDVGDIMINDLQIYNNTVLGSIGLAFDFTSGKSNGSFVGLNVRDNIVQGFGDAFFRYTNGAQMNNISFRKNIVFNNGNGNNAAITGGTPSAYTNDGGLKVNPDLNSNYLPNPGSPAIGASTTGGDIGYYGSMPPPPPPGPCFYTYSAWGPCVNGIKTRTVISAFPSGCTGTPILTDTCSLPPVACVYTYSAWGECINGVQSRTVLSVTPAGCIGLPVLTQTCTAPVTNLTVVSTNPPDVNTPITTTTKVSFIFSAALDAATINNSNISLKKDGVNQAFTVSVSGSRIYITAAKVYTFDKVYTIILSTNIADRDGNKLQQPYTFQFSREQKIYKK